MARSIGRHRISRRTKIATGLLGLALAAGGLVVATTSSDTGQAGADPANPADFVDITKVAANVKIPKDQANASKGTFTVNCGTNQNGHFNPDNFIAQPGVKNGAEHLHDYVGNLTTNADSNNQSLAAGGTTCKNGDKSAYFWPVIRIDRGEAEAAAAAGNKAKKAPANANQQLDNQRSKDLQQNAGQQIECPDVASQLGTVPDQAMAEVNRNLDLLDTQINEANQRLASSAGQGGPNFVQNAILGPLKDKRVSTIDRMAIAIGRVQAKPQLDEQGLATCAVKNGGKGGLNNGGQNSNPGNPTDSTGGGATSVPATSSDPAETSSNPAETSSNPAETSGNSAAAGGQQIVCPDVASQLSDVPAQASAEVNQNLQLLQQQIAEANNRLATSVGQGGPNFVQNAIVGPLKDKRVATINRIETAIGRVAQKPNLDVNGLAGCSVQAGGNQTEAGGKGGGKNNAGQNNGGQNNAGQNNGGKNNGGQNNGGAADKPGAEGPDQEIGNNDGTIVEPEQAIITFRGSAVGPVTAMPQFLRELSGDAKESTNGPGNARPSWTCTGFEDRITNKYVICPAGSKVERIHDFPGCWDGKNIDSANHRTHVQFADANSGKCPKGFKAIPQLRVTLIYDIPQDVQAKKQYKVDAFQQEKHNPFSDHDDFANVMSQAIMTRVVNCINQGKTCKE